MRSVFWHIWLPIIMIGSVITLQSHRLGYEPKLCVHQAPLLACSAYIISSMSPLFFFSLNIQPRVSIFFYQFLLKLLFSFRFGYIVFPTNFNVYILSIKYQIKCPSFIQWVVQCFHLGIFDALGRNNSHQSTK